MKFLRNIAKAVLAVSMLSVMVACEEEAIYTPAQTMTNAQVYFSSTNAKDVTIGMSDSEISVSLCRANIIGELDVQLKKNGSELMNVPSSVKFADGDSVAYIKVTFDPEAIGYDNPQSIDITLADSTMGTPYGETVYSLTAMIPSPWISLGKGKMTDAFIYDSETYFEVEIQQNELNTNVFRVVNPYDEMLTKGGYVSGGAYAEGPSKYFEFTILPEGYDFNGTILDREYVVYDDVRTGYYNPNYSAEVYAVHPYRLSKPWGSNYVLEYQENGLPGEVSIAPFYYMFGVGGWDYSKSTTISLLFPGFVKADYSAEVLYAGIFTAADASIYAVANLTLGADAKDVKAIVMTQADDAAAVADALAAGDLEGVAVQAGRIEVPFNAEELGSEKLQVIVAVMNEGAVKAVAASSFEYYGGGSNPWKSLGMGTYTESILCSVFKLDAVTYEIEILENTETPGLYRLMNVYANSTYPYAEDDCAAEGTYLEVNACDPEGVYVPQQSLGIDWGYGDISFVSGGASYLSNYDFETIKNAGYFGTLKDGVITLPNMKWEMSDGSFREGQGLVYMGTGLYGFGTLDGFRVTLPGAAAEAPKYARSQFVKNLERTFIGKKFAPVVNKRLFKRMAQPVF